MVNISNHQIKFNQSRLVKGRGEDGPDSSGGRRSNTYPCITPRSPGKLSSSQAGSLESSSLTGSLSLGPDLPHCQCCISYEARLKRLSCGHLYCDPCTDQIVNLAFEDIEGLSDYPCPMCKSLRQIGDLGPPSYGYLGTPSFGPCGTLQQQVAKEHGSRWG